MAAGTRRANFGPRAETNFYPERAQQMGKSLIIISIQRTDFSLMVVSQRTTMSRVVVEQQTNICPQVISAQRIDSGLIAVL